MPSRIGGRLLSDWEKGPPNVIGSKSYQPVAKYPSSSDASKEYTVCEVNDGTLSCDCPGWTRRNPPTGRTCRHVEDYDNLLRHDKAPSKVAEFFDTAAETVKTKKDDNGRKGGTLSDLFEQLDKEGL